MLVAQALEAIMLLCFGFSWPINAYKSYKARTVAGSSWQFILLITSGYVAGIAAKFVGQQINWVLAVYFLNLIFIGANWWVYFRNVKLDRARVEAEKVETQANLENPLRHILVASDGSASALKAATLAAEALHLAHLDTSVEVLAVTSDSSATATSQAQIAANITADILQKKGIPCTKSICEGNPAREIVKTVSEKGVDIVVMGSRGLTNVQQHMLGSVSHEVANHVGCPVFIVK